MKTCLILVAPLIVRAKLPWLKASWTMLLVTTTMAFVVQSNYAVMNFLEYHTSTEIRVRLML